MHSAGLPTLHLWTDLLTPSKSNDRMRLVPLRIYLTYLRARVSSTALASLFAWTGQHLATAQDETGSVSTATVRTKASLSHELEAKGDGSVYILMNGMAMIHSLQRALLHLKDQMGPRSRDLSCSRDIGSSGKLDSTSSDTTMMASTM